MVTERGAEAPPAATAELVPRPLPEEFVRWQLETRLAMLDRIGRGEHIPMFGAHLPVLVSHDPEGRFPAQTANKGVGFVPASEWLAYYTQLFRDVLARSEGSPAEATRAERVAAIRLLYEHPERLDPCRLGLLEIFEGATFRNLRRDGRATLHYTDSGPEYRSFQLNGVVEVAGAGDPRYHVILASRLLFEVETFHIRQPAYPWAYVFSVVEVYDKTPRHGRAGALVTRGAAPAAARAAVVRAPARPEEPLEARSVSPLAMAPVAIRDVLVGLDNSRYSRMGGDAAIRIAAAFGATLIGAHVYAARLHDRRFREMEAGLPERYHQPGVLERQRDVHGSLIGTGLELISDSYLATLERPARDSGLRWRAKRMEGKHHVELLRDIAAERYDLVVLGARGLGEDPAAGTLAPLGSVSERVLRASRSDVLLVKDDRSLERRIVVGIDGSPGSYGALRAAVALALRLGGAVEAVAVVDPDFHRRAFRGLAGVLSEEAGRRFKFREQERLHEEIIDAGIAKIYRDHLDVARRLASLDGVEIETTLLEGKAYPAILAHVARADATLLAVGRAGAHAAAAHEIGSNAENLARLAACNVLVSARCCDPAVAALSGSEPGSQASADGDGAPLRWSPDALASLERVPPSVRSFAKSAIETLARERGVDEVTPEVMRDARERSGMP